jgi:hypothetical protein
MGADNIVIRFGRKPILWNCGQKHNSETIRFFTVVWLHRVGVCRNWIASMGCTMTPKRLSNSD